MLTPKRGPAASVLTVAKADPEQKRLAFLNVHDEWPHHADPEEHLRRRLASVQHLRADWFVGLHEGKVVTSLGCYPLTLAVAGESIRSIGIGAVHTSNAYRGRGFAAYLLREVLTRAHAEGSRYALLYSDIGTPYYEKFGFFKIESLEFDICLADLVDEPPLPAIACTHPSPHAVLPTLMMLYDGQFTADTIGIRRDPTHFSWLLNREEGLQCSLIHRDHATLGYLLYKWDKNQLTIRDYAFMPELYRVHSLLALFRTWQITVPGFADVTVLRGWYHNNNYTYDQVALNAREREVTMVACLHEASPMIFGHHIFSWLDHF